jgi:DNA-binding MarR family transcriptional regulator
MITTSDFKQLQNCACFNVRKTSRMITQLFDHALKPSGIKITQFTLLGVLANAEEMAINELANSLGMDRSTLTRGIVRLEAAGLVKSREGDDARQRFVKLTTKGIKKINDTIPYWKKAQDAMEKELGENFPRFLDTMEKRWKQKKLLAKEQWLV